MAKPAAREVEIELGYDDDLMSALDARDAVISKFGGIIEKIEYNYDKKISCIKAKHIIAG